MRLRPSELDYMLILQEILFYGKGIPMEKFIELDDDLHFEFPQDAVTFSELSGSQIEM